MNSRKLVKTLFKKEIKDIFRDKKSVLMMFFVPVVLYPLIFFIAFLVISLVQTGVGTQTYNIVIAGNDGSALESRLLNPDEDKTDISVRSSSSQTSQTVGDNNTDRENKNNANTSTDKDSVTDISATALSSDKYVIMILDDRDFDSITKQNNIKNKSKNDRIKKALEDALIDAYVEVAPSGEGYTVNYNSSITNSISSYNLIEKAINKISLDNTKNKLKDNGLDPQKILHPIEYEAVDTATSEESFGFFLSTVIPFMIVISLLISVFTPAIDVTTGEKERGTLETLLMMPVTNTQIIVAKFFAVALIGIISTLLSILSMSALGAYMLAFVSKSLNTPLSGLDISAFIPAILLAIPVLIVLSLFLTAISMCVSCMAKSYKEANTYMSPVMIVVMLVGYIGFVPNINLDSTVAMIPVANVCLLIKNLLLFKINISTILVVLISLSAYTGLILLVLGKLYHSEAILFDEGRGKLSFLERRSNIKKGGVPSSGDAWFVIIIDILLLLYAGSMVQFEFGLFGVFLSQLIILSIPIIMFIYTRKNARETFSFCVPGKNALPHSRNIGPARAIAGGLIMGVGSMFMAISLSNIMTRLIPNESSIVNTTIVSFFKGNPIIVWLVIAVTPAICEELIFRGYILSAFRKRYNAFVCILLVGVTFGVFHTSVVRFPGTALLGLTFAYITVCTGSIFVSMVIHMLNNSLALLTYYFSDWFEEHFSLIAEGNTSYKSILLVAGISLVLYAIGALLLKKNKPTESA